MHNSYNDSFEQYIFTSPELNLVRHIRNIMYSLGVPVSNVQYNDTYIVSVNFKKYGFRDLFLDTNEALKFDKNKIKVSDMIDLNWIVADVRETEIEEDVYCAVAKETHSFCLEGNVLTHNCFAYDLEDLVKKGLFFVDNFNARPPKHLTTFTDFVVEFVSFTSNRYKIYWGIPIYRQH